MSRNRRLTILFALASTGCELVFPLERFEHNTVFITSLTSDGNLGGLAGADAKCQQAADNAGLTGTYIAWLADETTDAPGRLAGSRGWVRVDGEPIADLPGDLTARGPLMPIDVTETGAKLRGDVWTGASGDGSRAPGFNCGGWAVSDAVTYGRVGSATYGVGGFSHTTDVLCSGSLHLYCFETGKTTPVSPPARTGPIAFVSAQQWPPTTGIEAADTLCNEEAQLANLPGAYLAALAPAHALGGAPRSIASRFRTSQDYVRPDGVRLGFVLTSPQPSSFINRSATGDIVDAYVWTGGPPGTAPAGQDENCGDWLGNGTFGYIGYSNSASETAFLETFSQNCTTASSVYCLAM